MNRTERVLKVIHETGLSYADFARRVGVTKHLVSNWKNKNQEVSDKSLIRIIEQFKDVDARWLITGEDSRIKEQNDFEKLVDFYKKTIDLKDTIIRDKELIIKLKDQIIEDIKE